MNPIRFIPLVVFALASCGTASNTVTLPHLPRWQAPVQQGFITWQQVADTVYHHAPNARLGTSDATYTLVSAEFAQEIVNWTRTALWTQNKEGRGFNWTAESLDCDKFSKAFTLLVEIAASRAGVKAQPLACRIAVTQQFAFGGVPAIPGGGHSLVAIATDRGVMVVEPQSGVMVPLEQYPNRAFVFQVLIGG